MRITSHPTNNDVLKGAGDVVDLPITRVLLQPSEPWSSVHGDDAQAPIPAVRSYWKPTPKEIAHIVAGHAVVLEVYGQTHAPVYVGVSENAEHDLVTSDPDEAYLPAKSQAFDLAITRDGFRLRPRYTDGHGNDTTALVYGDLGAIVTRPLHASKPHTEFATSGSPWDSSKHVHRT